MKLISHRGNLNGVISDLENKPEYIIAAINQGYDVEIDIWLLNNKIFLGHDKAEYKIDYSFLLENKNKLWIHAKNDEALFFLNKANSELNYFWHEDEKFILTSFNYIWTHFNTNKKYFESSKMVGNNMIIVLPEKINLSNNIDKIKEKNYFGICSDFIDKYK